MPKSAPKGKWLCPGQLKFSMHSKKRFRKGDVSEDIGCDIWAITSYWENNKEQLSVQAHFTPQPVCIWVSLSPVMWTWWTVAMAEILHLQSISLNWLFTFSVFIHKILNKTLLKHVPFPAHIGLWFGQSA